MPSKSYLVIFLIISLRLTSNAAYGPPSSLQANTNLVKDMVAKSKNIDDTLINVKKDFESTKQNCLNSTSYDDDKVSAINQSIANLLKFKPRIYELNSNARLLSLEYRDSQVNNFRQVRNLALTQYEKRMKMIQLISNDLESVIDQFVNYKIHILQNQLKKSAANSYQRVKLQSTCDSFYSLKFRLGLRLFESKRIVNYGKIQLSLRQIDRILKDYDFFEKHCPPSSFKSELLNFKSEFLRIQQTTSKEACF